MKKVQITPSFWLAAAAVLLLGLGRQYSLLLAAALLHELGHGTVIYLLGNTVEEVRLIPGGVDIRYKERHFSYGADICIALAGPAVNLLTAMLLSMSDQAELDYFIGLNLLLCFFNLLPLYPLDGGKALYSAMVYFLPLHGETIFFLISAALTLLIFAAACGACFYDLQALWSMVVFGYILTQQKLHLLCKEGI